MPTHSAMARPARAAGSVGVLVAAIGLLVALAATPAVAVEAQGVRVDVAEPTLLGDGAVLRPAIAPGGSATYAIELRNQREQAVEVLVYGADVGPEGEVAPGTDNQGVGAWITADRPRVEVPPQSTASVEVTIRRPADDQDGGTGAIVAQLSDASRRELALARIQRAALRVEVAADGDGDGVHVEVVGTDARGLLVPDVLAVDVRFAASTAQEDQLFDGSAVLSRPLVDDPTYPAAVDVLSRGEEVTSTVEVDLPWYGIVGRVHGEAAVVGLTTRSAPVRVVVLPPWLALLLVAAAAAAVVLARRSGTPFQLRRGAAVAPVEDTPGETDAATVDDTSDEAEHVE